MKFLFAVAVGILCSWCFGWLDHEGQLALERHQREVDSFYHAKVKTVQSTRGKSYFYVWP
ncbi:hypothetical protein [Rufibacter immobilis]|uniref:hypothetical protein n=1 Tax=Rufibacter immobilis TaxID=1348778 RepID=UPI0035E5E58C